MTDIYLDLNVACEDKRRWTEQLQPSKVKNSANIHKQAP